MAIFLGTLIGAGMVGYAVKGLYDLRPVPQFKQILNASFATWKLGKITIHKIKETDYGFQLIMTLPSGLSVEKFKSHLPVLDQDTYSKIHFKHIKGRKCFLDIGKIDLDTTIAYSKKLPKKGLTVPFYSHFGLKTIDFWKESCWHFLLSGATGMGKSVLLWYILTHLFLSMKGKIKLYIHSNKITDFYMFRNIPQIRLTETEHELNISLGEVIREGERRKELVRQHDAVDIKKLRKKTGMEIPPVFVVIDEFGQLSDNETIQDIGKSMIETLRYVDVHFIFGTQRPDASSAIRPRIRANILGSMALSVRDAANSRMIVGTDEAENSKLGGIPGRAVLLDGLTHIVQVPKVTEDQIIELLDPYRSVSNEHERQENSVLSEEVPGIEPTPDRKITIPRESESPGSCEPGNETIESRGLHDYGSKKPGKVQPVYAEPDYYPSELHKD